MISDFSMSDVDLINKLQNDPSILFLGQSYYELDNQNNIALKAISEKFGVSDDKGFSSLFDIKNVSKDAIRVWVQKLFENLSLPESIKMIARYPWSHMYTSAIDSNLIRAFKSEYRSVQPVFATSYKITDPRSRTQLNETFLFGQIQYSDSEKASPLAKLEKKAREVFSNQLLVRLQRDIVTPKGVLLIEGWNPNTDWLSSEDFYPFLVTFGKEQIHLFSSTESIEGDEYISDLVRKQKLVLHTSKLSTFIDEAISQNLLDISLIIPDDDGTWLFFGEKRVKVPEFHLKAIKKSAILLSRKSFEIQYSLAPEELPQAFKKFISFSTTIPNWEGYTHGFAFRRDFIEQIIAYTNGNALDYPIILNGQASSGKTIGLGQVVFEIIANKQNRSAVLFIERSYKRLDENALRNIDEFGLWAEENGADKTIIVYDGMLNDEAYYSLLTNLTSRGRKILLIGSAYLKSVTSKNFISVPIELTSSEKKAFETFIKRVVLDRPALSLIIKNQDNKNFLSVLYHYLPESKSNINELIRREAKYYLDNVKESYTISNKATTKDLIIKDILTDLGFKESSQEDLNAELTIGGETGELATHFINLVMCIGKHGLSIPFELLIRALGHDSLQADFFNAIPNTDFIRWKEDHNGNLSVGPRTTLEASIFTFTLGGIPTEVSFIKKILSEIRDSFQSTQEDKEVEFATQLLQILKSHGSPFRRYIYDYANILGTLRKSKQAVHPRLMLQEASLLQESAKDPDSLPNGVVVFDILEDAEEVVKEALSIEHSSKSSTFIYLKVELASILGSMAKQTINNTDLSKSLFEEARDEILSFQFSTQNYHALDVLLWTIRDQVSITHSQLELSNLRAEAEHYLQFGVEEGFALENQEEFTKRKQAIGIAFKDFRLSEEAFEELKRSGSKAGYFLKAKEFIDGIDLFSSNSYSSLELEKINQAINYLTENFSEIKLDRHCLYLFLKLWWISKNSHPFFSKEKTVLQFKHQEWLQLLEMCNLLLEITELYISPTVKYLKGIAEFHINSDNYVETFKDLSDQTDRSNVGSRRIKKFYLASNEDGTVRKYSGLIESDLDYRNNAAMIHIDGLGKKVKCLYADFRQTFRRGDTIDFAIAFNFIGPVAVSLKNS